MRGIVISSRIYLPLEILAFIIWCERLVTMHLVPLVTLGGSKDRSIIIGAPTFNNSWWGGRPDISNVFKILREIG